MMHTIRAESFSNLESVAQKAVKLLTVVGGSVHIVGSGNEEQLICALVEQIREQIFIPQPPHYGAN